MAAPASAMCSHRHTTRTEHRRGLFTQLSQWGKATSADPSGDHTAHPFRSLVCGPESPFLAGLFLAIAERSVCGFGEIRSIDITTRGWLRQVSAGARPSAARRVGRTHCGQQRHDRAGYPSSPKGDDGWRREIASSEERAWSRAGCPNQIPLRENLVLKGPLTNQGDRADLPELARFEPDKVNAGSRVPSPFTLPVPAHIV